MLGVIFGAVAVGVDRLADNVLQPVTFDDELDLAGEPDSGRIGGRRGNCGHA
jgi:hypothetical protein